ncbi:MAG: hypothetical protein JRJ73_11965 [Deltaproteobacteria bacterium]|nr:hypothetical protein [Deltaproteobacteria bacterium]
MNEKERLNALEVALNNETREREFYLKNAERMKNWNTMKGSRDSMRDGPKRKNGLKPCLWWLKKPWLRTF